MSKIELGQVRVPSGTLLIVDPGLSRQWSHDRPPTDEFADAEQFDLQIVGTDAIAAGTAFDRQSDPEFLYDVQDVAAMKALFAKVIGGLNLDAKLKQLDRRIPHLERAKLALNNSSNGAAVVHFGVWGVVVNGIPQDRLLTVVGHAIDEGDFSGRFRTIDIEIDSEADVAHTEVVEGVMVDHGQLICSDMEAFGHFKMWDSLDDLADYVFWGPDAAQVAQQVDAGEIEEGVFGWVNVPMNKIGPLAQAAERLITDQQLKAAVDYRPHCNLNRLNEKIRASDNDAGEIELDGQPVCGFGNRWGDGIFPIVCEYDGDRRLVRIRMDVGNEQRQDLMRQVTLYHSSCIVTNRSWVDGQPIQFADRLAPEFQGDSGWFFSSGTEDSQYMDNPANLTLLKVQQVVDRFPEVKPIITAATGSQFHREGDGFVPG